MSDFGPIPAAAQLMATFPHPWFVSGGWAIDLFVNRVTRPHSDLEIGLFREYQNALRAQLAGWRLTKSDVVAPETMDWVPWSQGDWVAPPRFQVQAWSPEDREPTYAFLLNDTVDGAWQFRREPSITRPISDIVPHWISGILPASARCHAGGGPGRAGGRVLHFWDMSQVADALDAIEVVHSGSSVRSPVSQGKAVMLSPGTRGQHRGMTVGRERSARDNRPHGSHRPPRRHSARRERCWPATIPWGGHARRATSLVPRGHG